MLTWSGCWPGCAGAGSASTSEGHDVNYLSLTGALNALGRQDECPPPPLSLVGGLRRWFDAAGGVLAASWNAAPTGEGQVVDAAMVDGVVALWQKVWSLLAENRWVDDRESNFIDGHAPWYRTYRRTDGNLWRSVPSRPSSTPAPPRPVLGEAPTIRRSPSARASSRRGAYQAAPAPRFSRTPAGLPEPLRDVHHLGSRAAGGLPADGAHRRADGVSNTPVREALLALCSWSCVQLVLCSWSCAAGPAQPVLRSEGLVELVPRRGFIVASFSRQDVRDQFWAQAQLARELAARAAKRASDPE